MEVETEWSDSQKWTNLEESSKEGCCSDTVVFAVMMIMLLMILDNVY
jgi:hypothetical protein